MVVGIPASFVVLFISLVILFIVIVLATYLGCRLALEDHHPEDVTDRVKE